ncbi:hypothetical protein ZEAMMB73_Zm00001d028119 [Zea mays]|uniref:Uncharacterized protein n=1 Tax=Zea mays TaxID=4577 RepID=A0A1D6JS79_MAIZE|nr:hypothetical protein ZEAMMB73_Zm00001d028119 [Zea mays]ONL94769.1 hypothetical protein ZEAMMB73_Zm00001d028119 [Zea mays]ONL94774.1 hypothetical protein ZEAMMB73_Zm00001d028119 [Zea mays]
MEPPVSLEWGSL